MTTHTNCFLLISLLGVHSSQRDYFTWFDSFPALYGSFTKPCTRLFVSLGKIQSYHLCWQKLQPNNAPGSPGHHNTIFPQCSPPGHLLRQRAETTFHAAPMSMLFPPLSICQRQNRLRWSGLRWKQCEVGVCGCRIPGFLVQLFYWKSKSSWRKYIWVKPKYIPSNYSKPFFFHGHEHAESMYDCRWWVTAFAVIVVFSYCSIKR